MSLERNEYSNRDLNRSRVSHKNLKNYNDLYNPKTPSPMRFLRNTSKMRVLPIP